MSVSYFTTCLKFVIIFNLFKFQTRMLGHKIFT